ncbi:hypothetical protein EYF80_036175 [Liparis tanakae]|uniref:Uncharacterized protein n=1 Tax=Liparis tanakae TaxID=230148 RepID=A0A4Z2GK54_9TELE|nr:hypothetical protein EYF80_036175 [Liparis tanakae]
MPVWPRPPQSYSTKYREEGGGAPLDTEEPSTGQKQAGWDPPEEGGRSKPSSTRVPVLLSSSFSCPRVNGLTCTAEGVADVNNAGDFASRRRGLPGRADGIIDGDGNARFLLADGATDEGVAGGHWDKERTVCVTTLKLYLELCLTSSLVSESFSGSAMAVSFTCLHSVRNTLEHERRGQKS